MHVILESIRELRCRKNFTLRKLSEKTGYTVSFLSQLERGLNLTPQEFAAFVRGGALQAAPIPDFEQEDSAHEEI